MASEWSLPSRFSNQNSVCISHVSRELYMLNESYPPLFDHLNEVWRILQLPELLIMHYSQPRLILSLMGPNIFIKIILSHNFQGPL